MHVSWPNTYTNNNNKKNRVQFGFPSYQERVMKKDAQISHQTISSTMHTNNEKRRREEYEAY